MCDEIPAWIASWETPCGKLMTLNRKPERRIIDGIEALRGVVLSVKAVENSSSSRTGIAVGRREQQRTENGLQAAGTVVPLQVNKELLEVFPAKPVASHTKEHDGRRKSAYQRVQNNRCEI
jgi:hypothetical protein